MSAEERLLRYCRIDTQSDPDNEGETPSTACQFDLARVLEKELREIGVADAETDEHCYVYGHIASNIEKEVPAVGFIAHMDTAPDFSGRNVKPRIIEKFDGNDIRLNENTVMKMEDFPYMRKLKGNRLVVTDGTTLLGADDKAGIVSIMEAVSYLHEHPEAKHGKICIGFTPDEEIGNGPKYFDIEKFGAQFAYTMDGGDISAVSDETFNASSAELTFKGFSIHPGSAKDKMINAASVACEYQNLLPEYMTPEHTEGRDGFIHLIGMEGDSSEAHLSYIIRDHDSRKLEMKKQLMKKAAGYVNELHGEGTAQIEIKDTYRNMKEVLSAHPEATELAWQALQELSVKPVNEVIRGGTDGAQLSFRGLPCPNLGNGGGNCHGPYEYCVIDQLETAAQLILKIAEDIADGAHA
jgi:tripeptide aminopeptidase